MPRAAMQQNIFVVAREGKLRARQQELLNNITKLQEEALKVNEKVFTIKSRVDTLIQESQAIFLNGLTPLDIAQDIINKVEETRKVFEDVKQNFEIFVSRV